MSWQKLLKPGLLVLLPIVALLVLAVGCGEDATPTRQPTNTTQPTATPAVEVVAPTSAPVDTAAFFDAVSHAAKHGETPRRGGIFKTGLVENYAFNDYQFGYTSNFYSQGPLYNALLMSDPYNFEAELIPDLAYAWDVSNDGKTYTFKIHEGVKFHDGVPLTAEDVRYSYDRILKKGLVEGNTDNTGHNFWLRIMWDVIFDSFAAPDPATFVINAKGPSPLILQIVGNGYSIVVPKHISAVDPVNAINDNPFSIGSGPLKMKEPIGTLGAFLERNDDYFKPGLPYIDGYEAHLILDIQVRATAVLTERIHMNHPGSSPFLDWETAKSIAEADPAIIHEAVPTTWVLFLNLNSRRKGYDDTRIRQAVSHAIDRTELVALDPRTGTTGLGVQRGYVGTILNPNNADWRMPDAERQKLVGYLPDYEAAKDEARRLIADYEAEVGPVPWDDLPFMCGTQHVSCEIANLVQAQLKRVGADIPIEPAEIVDTWGRQFNFEHTMTSFFIVYERDDPSPLFGQQHLCDSLMNFQDRCIPELDTLYDSQIFETDHETRKQTAWQMNELAMNDAGNMILYWGLNEHIRRDYVKGWTPRPFYWDAIRASEFLWLDI